MAGEYERLQQALALHGTPEGRKGAAQAMRDYLAANGSNASLSSLQLNEGYPNNMPLDSLAARIESDPNFAKLMDDIVNNR